VLGVLVLVPVGFLVVSDVRLMLARRAALLSAEQRADLTRLLDAREKLARLQVEAWNAIARREAAAALKFSEEPCPLSLPAPTPVSAATYVKFGFRDSAFGDWPLCVLGPEAEADACARTWVATEEDATLRARLQAGEVYSWDLEAATSAPPLVERPRVLVVADTETPFKLREAIVGRLSFNPGVLSGRAFAFDPTQGRFVCGAAVTAQNSKDVETEFDELGGKPSQLRVEEEARAALVRDLEVRARLALGQAWRKLAE
jgi:hypothetical protein